MDVTLIAFDAYPLLSRSTSGGIGGAEVRAVTFARGLRALGNIDVKLVVAAEKRMQTSVPEQVDGFLLFPYRKPQLGPMRKLRQSIAKRLRRQPPMNRFFQDLATDTLLCFGVRNDTASIVRSARASGKRCLVFLTSDRNIDDACRKGRHDRGAYGELGDLCRYTLQHADQVIAQTEFQQNALRSRLGIESRLIRNPINVNGPMDSYGRNQKGKLLWVGRADTFSKRADLCIELARRCPQHEFQLIMNNHDNDTFQMLKNAAPTNVEIVERVAFEEIEELFQNAQLLLNTSAAEGFPNTFLQAAKYGKPIVSLEVDSGQMLSHHGCGICVEGDLDRMVAAIDALLRDRVRYDAIANRSKQYVRDYHDATARCSELAALISSLCCEEKIAA